jgi:hypothetical protein
MYEKCKVLIVAQPASFLNKYKKVSKPDSNGDYDKTAVDDASFNKTDENGKPSSSLAPSLYSLDAPGPKIVDTVAPYELSIKWIVNNENPVFDEEDEQLRRMPHPRSYQSASIFWRHPVRYLDRDSKNLFRTVMVDYIPENATYADVLNEIYAGSLEKIELVPAIGKATNYKTARVVFNHELGASTTANYARDHGMKIKGQHVRVWQVLTQTYPKNNEVEDQFDSGFTRVLVINKATEEALSTLPTKLDGFKRSIVELGETFDLFPSIEFTSIATAVAAMMVLMADPDFQGAQFDFDDDPCGEPYPFTR